MFRDSVRSRRHHLTALRRSLLTSVQPTLRPLRVLGLESSADDACVAIVTSDRRILSNVVYKQHDINAKYGGIHPLKAQEAHMRDLPLAISQALRQADMTLGDVDAVAYTRGPGMYGCLSVAATSARALAAAAGLPVIGVHHMQAHALTPLLTETTPPEYPFLVLLVSGGHTMLVLATSQSKFKIVMKSLDNSIGDSIDKAARFIHLPFSTTKSQGAILEHYASLPSLPPFKATPANSLKLPLSTNKEAKTLAVSFSGLLHAFEKEFKKFHPNPKIRPVKEGIQREMSRIFQEAAVGHLVAKVGQVIEFSPELKGVEVKGLVVSGGVAGNQYLREKLQAMLTSLSDKMPIQLFFPPVELCTDNAAMIAWTGILRLKDRPQGDPRNLPIRKKWSLEDLYDDLNDE